MHHLHVAGGARLVTVDGWEVPSVYGGAEAEAQAVRAGAGLWDLSILRKWDLQGAAVGAALQPALAAAPGVGRAAQGRLGDEPVMVLRLREDRALVVGPRRLAADAAQRAVPPGTCAHVTDVSSGMAALRLAGPGARAILATLTPVDLADGALPDLACLELGLARVHAVLLRRDLGGLPAFEMYLGRNYGAYLWEACQDAGRGRGLVACGMESERAMAGSPR